MTSMPRQGSLTGRFTLEATDVASIALADSRRSAPPLLGYRPARNRRLPGKGRAWPPVTVWTVAQASECARSPSQRGPPHRVRSMGYVSSNGEFLREVRFARRCLDERGERRVCDLACDRRADQPPAPRLPRPAVVLRRRRDRGDGLDQRGERSRQPSRSPSGTAPSDSPILAYVTAGGDLEVLQGRLVGRFSLQARTRLVRSALIDASRSP